MNLLSIQVKIIKKDHRKYSFFCFSVILSLALFGALGVIMYSPTVTNVLMTEGSTYIISYALYFISLLGIFVFLFYANSVYLKYKSKEIGLSLSFGLPKKKLESMLKFEYSILFLASSLIGIALSVPIAFAAWSSIAVFLTTSETAFKVGWRGLLMAIILGVVSFITLLTINIMKLRRQNIISMIKFGKEVEVIKSNSFWRIIVGLVLIILGSALFVLDEFYMLLGGNYTFAYLAFSLVGLYLFTSQITQIGNLFHRFNIRMYNRNFLFYNLMRQKGKQYTLSLFVSTVLICVTCFAAFFNAVALGMIYFETVHEPTGLPGYAICTNRVYFFISRLGSMG